LNDWLISVAHDRTHWLIGVINIINKLHIFSTASFT